MRIRSIWIVISFSFKILGTFLLQFIYTYIYTDRSTSDIFRFYDDRLVLKDLAQTNFAGYLKVLFGLYDTNGIYKTEYFEKMNSWIKPFESGFYNDNIVMIKVNSFLSMVTQSGYEANSIFFSSMAFIGLLLIISILLHHSKDQRLTLLIISIFPCYLLLLSGGLKESFLLFGAGLFLAGIITESGKRIEFTNVFMSAIGLLILIIIKPYFIASLAPALVSYFLILKLKWRPSSQWMVWFMLLGSGATLLYVLNFDLVEYVVRKQNDFINHSDLIKPGSAIAIVPLEYSVQSVVLNLPSALFRVLAEPLPSRINSASLLIMAFENILLIGLIITAIFRGKYQKTKRPLFHMIIQGVLPALCLIGLISPVLGATMRYRAPFIVLLIIAIISFLTKSHAEQTT
jgi:hypothetical protein